MESELFSISTDALQAISSQLPGFMAKLEAVEDRQLKLFDRFEANESVTSALCVAINDLVKVLVTGKAAGIDGACAAEATYINNDQTELGERDIQNKCLTNSDLPIQESELSSSDTTATSLISAVSGDATSECSTAHASGSTDAIRNQKKRRRYKKRKNTLWVSQQKVFPNDHVQQESWEEPRQFPGRGNQWDSCENRGEYRQGMQRGGPWGGFRPPAGRPTAALLMGRPRHGDSGRRHGEHWMRSRGHSQDIRTKIIDFLNTIQSSYVDHSVSSGHNYRHY